MKIAQNQARKYLVSFCFLAAAACMPAGFSLQATEANTKIKEGKDVVKRTVHKAVDSLEDEKINQLVDEVAAYLDKDKFKSLVDQMADYFEPEKIKQMIDVLSQTVNRETVKEAIDMLFQQFDKEKIKTVATQMLQQIDKEKIKSQFDQKVDRTAEALSSAYDNIKNEIRQYGSNVRLIQEHLSQYDWHSSLPDKATSEVATLSDLKLNGHKKIFVARPGEQIKGEVICDYNRDECSPLRMYRVVIGIKNRGSQTTVGNHIGMRTGKELQQFVLTAPKEPGIYEVGFSTIQAALETNALNEWNELSNPAIKTVGLIIVR